MGASYEIMVQQADITWALLAARESLARWAAAPGYYSNRLNSHFKGRLGEIAVETWLIQHGVPAISHFRHADREALCDIETQAQLQAQRCRIEVKTWSAAFWPALGRCVAIAQVPALRRKADCIVWCVVALPPSPTAEQMQGLSRVAVDLVGWSTLDDVCRAPMRITGTGNMRPVHNYQLDATMMRSMTTFVPFAHV